MLMRRGQALAVVAVLGSLLLLLRDVTCGYQPQYERDVQIMFGGEYSGPSVRVAVAHTLPRDYESYNIVS